MLWKTALTSLLFVSCAARHPAEAIPIAAPKPESVQAAPPASQATPPPPAKPETALQSPRAVQTSLAGISISGVSFDSRSHRLAVADQEAGPGSKWPDASHAAKAYRGIAAINAGFFTPEGKPLGLVVAGGKKSGSLNRASSLGAGLFSGGGSPTLQRREHPSQASEILQAGPFLAESGQATAGLSPKSSTARSFIAWDGTAGWILARTGPCSLADLATALAGSEIGGVKIRSALNLDGGRSSDLWISNSVPGGPLHERPIWNKPVRNFLILLPR
ncbi:phosphodiester glycosidase family protein [Luteolibacter sp. Populi]|uniref:phosphodiester glycosidase family protein n=1 Tax=Luteolibacter sp. Populi TaxID=3230487 RepID=UPI003465DE5B